MKTFEWIGYNNKRREYTGGTVKTNEPDMATIQQSLEDSGIAVFDWWEI